MAHPRPAIAAWRVDTAAHRVDTTVHPRVITADNHMERRRGNRMALRKVVLALRKDNPTAGSRRAVMAGLPMAVAMMDMATKQRQSATHIDWCGK